MNFVIFGNAVIAQSRYKLMQIKEKALALAQENMVSAEIMIVKYKI